MTLKISQNVTSPVTFRFASEYLNQPAVVKAAHLNGEHGVCVSYNADGKRRLGVRLSKSKKTLALAPHNCRALDPERATCTFRAPSSRAQGACLASSLL